MIQSPLDAELDPTLDPMFEQPPRIANTLPPPPQTSPSSDPRMERFPLDEPTPAGVDSGVSVVPPIDQGTYGPPPGVNPTAPPPVYPPNVGEAPSTPPVESDAPPSSRMPAPKTASPDPVVEPSTYNTLPAAVPFPGGIISEDFGLNPPTTGSKDPSVAPYGTETQIPAQTPPPPLPPQADAPAPAPPPLPEETPAPPPPQAEAAATPPTQQPPAGTAAEDERMRRLLAANAESRPTEVPTTAIDPENNLVGQQISPADSARLQGRAAAADEQLARIAGTDRNAAAASHAPEAIDPAISERHARLRAMQDEQLAKVRNTPDRYNLARQRFGEFEKDTAPEYDLNRKKALGDAANFGYTGSGRLNTDYGNLELQRERDMDSQRSRLFNTALDKTVDDDRELLSTLERFSGNESAYDQQTRDELRKERSHRIAQGDADVDAEYRKGTTLSGAERDQRGVEEGTRDEMRGERGYQRSLAERALADQMDAAKMQEDFTQSEFERDDRRTRTGYANDPTEQYEQAARQAAREGEISAEELSSILAMIAQQRQQGQGGVPQGVIANDPLGGGYG